MPLLPYWLNLDSVSVIRLAALILSVAIVGYLLRRRQRTTARLLLALAFAGAALFNAASFLEFAGRFYWQPRTLKNLLVPILQDAGPGLAFVCLTAFAYHFPRPRDRETRERRIIVPLSILLCIVRLASAAWVFGVLERGRSDIRLTEPYYYFLYASSGFQLLLIIAVLLRTSARLSAGRSRPWWTRLTRPRGGGAQAARALGLTLLLPVAALGSFIIMTSGVLSHGIATYCVWLGFLLFYLAFVSTYLNTTSDTTTLRVKLVGFSLITVLGLIGLVGLVVGRASADDFQSDLPALSGRSIRFTPNRAGSYDVREIAIGYDEDIGGRLPISYAAGSRVVPSFEFPFFGTAYRALHVVHAPIVYLGDVLREDGWGGYHPQPAIAAVLMNLDPGSGGGVFLKERSDAVTITWEGMSELGVRDRITVQLILHRDGSIDMTFADMQPASRYPAEKMINYTAAITRGGDPAPGAAPAPYGPRLTGLHPGGERDIISEVDLVAGLPWEGSGPGIIVDSWEAAFTRHLHERMSVIAVILLAGSLFVLFVFPALFRVNLIRPLESLSMGMHRAETGDLQSTVPLQSDDEIGYLTRSFNRMLEAIREAETSFQMMADTAEEGIIITQDGDPVYANVRACELTGYSLAAMEDTGIGRIVPAAVSPAETSFRSRETVLANRSGREIIAEVSLSPASWHGRPAQAIIVRDITERRKTEEKERERNDYLVQVDKLTALGVLAAGVAHEINSPNQAILANASVLVRAGPQLASILDDFSRENPGFLVAGLDAAEFGSSLPALASEIRKCSDRIEGIIRGLKDFSRQDPGAPSGSLDVNAVVLSALELVSGHLRRATERFSTTLEEGLPRVRGNAQRLEQVIVNLLLNACQSLPDRRCAIRVSSRSSGDGREVMVEVRDEGAGISPDVLGRLAEPFFTTRQSSGGTGLGLYVSRKIVEEHGGTLVLESEPGRGTKAVVTLPAGEPT
jgi:PAS domain S-box-containing protein